MPSWPSNLPGLPLAGKYEETPPETVLRTPMDEGPAKLRRRGTAGVRRLKLEYLLDASQVAALDAFYLEDVRGGALSFSFAHPREGELVSCRFRAAPVYAAEGALYRAAVELEVLP